MTEKCRICPLENLNDNNNNKNRNNFLFFLLIVLQKTFPYKDVFSVFFSKAKTLDFIRFGAELEQSQRKKILHLNVDRSLALVEGAFAYSLSRLQIVLNQSPAHHMAAGQLVLVLVLLCMCMYNITHTNCMKAGESIRLVSSKWT